MSMIHTDDLSLIEIDYYLEPTTTVLVDEAGTDNVFECDILEFLETDVADGEVKAKKYEAVVSDPKESEYKRSQGVIVDNRDVEKIYNTDMK